MKKLFLLITILTFGAASLFAQNITQQSYNQGKEVLDKSVAAYGGLNNLRSIQNFSIRAEGDLVHRNQSRKTFFGERTPYRIEFTIDLKNSRFWQKGESSFPGGFASNNHQVFDGKDVTIVDFIRKTQFMRPAPVGWRNRLRWFPQFLLLNGAERVSRVRYVGKTTFNNRPHEVIT